MNFLDDFVKHFMDIYDFYTFEQAINGKRRCKNCRYFKRRLSEYEIGAIKQEAEYIQEGHRDASEFSICKAATDMALKAIENENERGPIIVHQNGYCTLFKISILRAIKNIFHKQAGQA
jgi:hypothetical protein